MKDQFTKCARLFVLHADFQDLVRDYCPRCMGNGEECLAARMAMSAPLLDREVLDLQFVDPPSAANDR